MRRSPEVVPEADRTAALAMMNVSRETAARLDAYVALLHRWQSIKNLVGPATLPEVWTRHIADSAQVVEAAPDARVWVDLGSGAGFPGLVVAILLANQPGVSVHLVESNARKSAFLRDVARATGAPATVHAGRIEAVLPKIDTPVDVVTSRALAPLPELVGMSETLLRRGAIGLFLTGEGADAAIEASASSPFHFTTLPSRTRAAARIVRVGMAAGERDPG